MGWRSCFNRHRRELKNDAQNSEDPGDDSVRFQEHEGGEFSQRASVDEMQSVGCGELDPPASLFRNCFPSPACIGTLEISRLYSRSEPRAETGNCERRTSCTFSTAAETSASPDREVARDHFRLSEQRLAAAGGAPGRFTVVESKSEITAPAQAYLRWQLYR